jgi:glycosyltransferase involved in cell wall biosynthesis
MRITILTQYYPPETGAPQNRLSDLAERLHRRGHDIQVLTAFPNYPGTEIHPEYVGRRSFVEYFDHVPVVRVPLYVPKHRTILRRLTNYLSFAFNSRIHGPKFLRPADILLMESPPLFIALAGVPLARRLKARLVTNVSDLWPKALRDLGLKAPNLCWAAMSWVEKWMYNSSKLITAQTEGIVQDIRKRFPEKRVVLFPNGVALESYPEDLQRDRIRQRYGWNCSTIVFGYTGVLGPSQALHQVLQAASRLKSFPQIHFALFGDGPCRESLEHDVNRLNLSNVRIYGHLPSHAMPHVQAAFDVGLVPLANTSANRGARPSKMFELMAARCPLVICAEGEAARLIDEAPTGPIGISVPPEQPEQLAEVALRLSQDPERLRIMGRHAREFVLSRFDRATIARQLEKEFEVLLSVGTHP